MEQEMLYVCSCNYEFLSVESCSLVSSGGVPLMFVYKTVIYYSNVSVTQQYNGISLYFIWSVSEDQYSPGKTLRFSLHFAK
jgi:hypothetical protein